MEQPALLTIIRTDNLYRFRLDLLDNPARGSQEYVTELNAETAERLRRALQGTAQYMQTLAFADAKRQTTKMSNLNDSPSKLGRFLFDTLIPPTLQDALRRLDGTLMLNTNTPDIPWEILFDGGKSGRFLCQSLSIGRQVNRGRDTLNRMALPERSRKLNLGRREPSGLSVLFLVNPSGEYPAAEEEVASLCTYLPESISRIILYRQQANQLEMRMRISADYPQVLHYAGPLPVSSSGGEPVLALAGSSRLDSNAIEQLFQALPKRPLIFLSYQSDEGRSRNGNTAVGQQEREEAMERLAENLITAGAGAVLTSRWPLNPARAREFAALFYQEVADGVTLGEAMRRARISMAQPRPDDASWLSFLLYGDPTQRLVTASTASKERAFDVGFDADLAPHADDRLDHLVVFRLEAARRLDLELHRLVGRVAARGEELLGLLGIVRNLDRGIVGFIAGRVQCRDRRGVAAQQALGGRQVGVAGAGDQVDRVEHRAVGVGAAVGQQRDRLRAPDRPHLVDAEHRGGGHDRRMRKAPLPVPRLGLRR